jgi:hypothetical protein
MAEFVTFRSILFDQGKKLDRREAIARHGSRAVRIAEIMQALAERDDTPPPLRSPKRIFVSYKWGSNEHNASVRGIVTALRARGNIVVFDEQAPRTGRDIGTLVSLIVECHYFMMIIEPEYIEVIAESAALAEKGKARLWKYDWGTGQGVLDRGWVHDEFKIHEVLTALSRIAPVGLLVSGDEVPRGMTLDTPGMSGGNVFDIREPESIERVLDTYFTNEERVPTDTAKTAAALVHRSQIAFARDDFVSALALSDDAIAAAPNVSDGYRCKTFATLALGQFEDAVDAAHRVSQLEPHHTESDYMLALAVAEHGRPDVAIGIATRRRRLGVRSWRLSAVQAIALWCVGRHVPAVNQIAYACSLEPRLESILQAYHDKWGKQGERHPPNQTPIHLLGADSVQGSGAIGVLQLHNLTFERTFIAIEGNFPENRSMLARDRIIASLSGHHLPVTDVASLRFRGGTIVGSALCSACPAKLPIQSSNEALCADCGIVLEEMMEPCPACEQNSMHPLSGVLRGGTIPCPYCRMGVIAKTSGKT